MTADKGGGTDPVWRESMAAGHRVQADILQVVVDEVLTHPGVRTLDDVRRVLLDAIAEFRRKGGGRPKSLEPPTPGDPCAYILVKGKDA